MSNVGIEAVDRLSELPKEIVHHVFSFLTFREVVQASVLSKSWEKTWHTYPVFEFDRRVYGAKFWDRYSSDEERNMEITRRIGLMNCFEQTSLNRFSREMISIKKLTLDMNKFVHSDEFILFVNKIIRDATKSNVKNLNRNRSSRCHEWYKLPEVILCTKSIEVLEFRDTNTMQLPRNTMDLPPWKKRCLSGVQVNDYKIENLVSGYPLIDDSSLEMLYIQAYYVHLLSINGPTTSLEMNLALCKNLKSLSFSDSKIEVEWPWDQISKLHVLEYLSIRNCSSFNSIKISSSSLKTLSIFGCVKLIELNIDTPYLHCFDYRGDIIPLSINAPALSKVSLNLPRGIIVTKWYVEYVKLLAKFHQFSEVLNLRSNTGLNVIVPEELRQMLHSPLSSAGHLLPFPSIRHLKLNLFEESIDILITKFVDSLLWISPHIMFVSIEYGLLARSSIKFQFTYKKQLIYQGETASCCKSLPVSCWQHCIEEVKLEIIDINLSKENQPTLFTVNGENILEKIDAILGAQFSRGKSTNTVCHKRRRLAPFFNRFH
ncbi:hypothetical protein LWI28_004272 [Acer negundo]|uniref:F-box domain-containing protein n=1 Tax=Acer negundo TaxID=4023 RepID=A0AAD5NHR0_ACENE|nr:hypothetical protein LWI28_004272 [Acer negundo]